MISMPLVLVPLGAGLALAGWLRERARAAHAEAAALKEAAILLERHTTALQELLDHPRASDQIRSLALDLSDSFECREQVETMLGTLLDEKAMAALRRQDRVPVLDDLLEHEPVVHDLFMRAAVSGLLAGLLLFPETRRMMLAAATRLASDGRREIGYAAANLPLPSSHGERPAYA